MRPKVARQTDTPMFLRAQVVASDALQAARLAVCGKCQFNKAGSCKQCCGSVPVTTLVHLVASRCARHFWKE